MHYGSREEGTLMVICMESNFSCLTFIPGTPSNGIEIFYKNNDSLRVANPTLASRIEKSNVGEFSCEYDDYNIYKADINIIGFPPVINRAGMLPSNSIRIGTKICISQSPVFEVRVNETGLNNMIYVYPPLLLEYNMQGPPLNGAMTVHRGDGTIVPPCPHSDNDLFVSCADSAPDSTVEWYINGVL
uniref:Uncharacterized protein n=1 Tax=Amphimedon queenslandica TaxID=400682 RepID=A0A1X7T195_AMPQE